MSAVEQGSGGTERSSIELPYAFTRRDRKGFYVTFSTARILYW